MNIETEIKILKERTTKDKNEQVIIQYNPIRKSFMLYIFIWVIKTVA